MADHVFICYARQDQDFVLKLAANLKERGVPVWLDQWDIPPGDDWDEAIDEAISECAQFLIVLSPTAVASREVRGELRTALNQNKPIVPVLYRKCSIPRQLLSIQYADFTARGPDDGTTLARVLRALGKSVEPEMILIPAGEFLMGSKRKNRYARNNEKPQHRLYLPDYYMAKTPVTNAQYAAFVQDTGHRQPTHWGSKHGRAPRGRENYPVVYVSWYEAVDYCGWLSIKTGKPYRLPSEAEWEKAARGTNGRTYPWGKRWNAGRCNSSIENSNDITAVGSFLKGASPYGLLDMAGNVLEWTLSLWGKDSVQPDFWYPYILGDEREDLRPGDEMRRVLRGGSFTDTAGDVRCAVRREHLPYRRFTNVGFRVTADKL